MSINQQPTVTKDINSSAILAALQGVQSAQAQVTAALTELAGESSLVNVNLSAEGLATSRLQEVGNAAAAVIAGNTTLVAGRTPALVGGAVPVVAALPTGASTSALQVSGNATLSSIADVLGHGINADSFSRLRVSEPAFRFDAQLTYQINTDVWDTKVATSGTVAHDSAMRAATLTAAASAGSSAILQSHYHVPYTPGRSQLAFITFLLGAAPSAGVTRRVGYYGESADAGVYLEQTSTGLRLALRTGGTGYANQSVEQADWNIDPLLGAGPSGITLNPAKVQILVISLQALYVGRVVVAFDIDGELVPVHQFVHANRIAYTYMSQASLPVHYSIRTSSGSGGAMTAICASVMSEGGEPIEDMQGRIFSAGNGVTSIAVTTRRPIFSIIVKAQLNGLNQNAVIVPVAAELMARTNNCYVEIVRNGTLTGPSWSDVDAALSGVQRDVTANAIANGQVIESFMVPASATLRTASEKTLGGKAFLCYSHLLGAGDTLSVVVTSQTGTCDAHGCLKWKEIR